MHSAYNVTCECAFEHRRRDLQLTPDPEDSEEDVLDPELRVSTFFSRIEVDFVRKIEPMLLEEHVPA
eukprot:1740804-Amphidinium_carterae.1